VRGQDITPPVMIEPSEVRYHDARYTMWV
jgi:hypothetical protein